MKKTAKIRVFQRLLVCAAAVSLAMTAQAEEKTVAAAGSAPAGETLTKSAGDLRPGLAGSFLSGRFARQNKDPQEAAKYLAETLSHDPDNEPLQVETMRMQLLAGNVVQATELAKKLDKAKNNDPIVASLLMVDRVKANDFSGAKAAVEHGSGAGLFGLIRPVMLEWIAVGGDEKKKSVDLTSAIDKAGFFAPFINYHSALMNDVLGNKPLAQLTYAKANVDPAVTPYRVVEAIANFNARQGKWEDAQAVYDAYARANPQSSLIPDKLVAGPAPKPTVADAKQGLAELYFTTASILFGEEATQDTFLYLRLALELRPNLAPAQLMLANLYEQTEDYKQAIATYDGITESSVFARRAQIRKALNYEAMGQKDKAISILDAQAAAYPNDAAALITKGDMQRDAKKYSEAAETYGQAIKRTEPLSNADWPLLYARGISYERAGEWDKAEADFKRALVLEPNQPDVLNYLAYSWLTMNKNLLQAREYLEIAADQRPDDVHILDSVGWSYYLSGDFQQAVEKFEQAVEAMPDDATVNEHLGDAYWRIGRTTEAKYQWERALANKPEKDAIDGLKDKLAKGMEPFVLSPEMAKAQMTPKTNSPHTQVQ